MALITSYATLQSEALDWMERAGQSGNAPTWVQLAEAKLNREIPAIETDATLTGVVGSNAIDISSLSMAQPVSLFLAETGRDERKIDPAMEGTYAVSATSGRPSLWSIDGSSINFDRPLDGDYPFRFRYRQKLNLAVSDPNWLLTNHPDVYLAATLMWGAGYNESWSSGQLWKSVLDETIPQIRSQIAQGRRAVLRVDNALAGSRSYSVADWTAG